ncbi:MAG: glycoside hydrolase family 127 protein [Actinomycetales bacterium]|nr:glycoside hydrolase family 127 protein [Actinomycetales bacterium]
MPSRPLVQPTDQAAARLTPLAPEEIRLGTAGYLADRIAVNREVSIPHALEMLDAWGALAYLAAAAGGEGPPITRPLLDDHLYKILDSDVFKWLEALATEQAHRPVAPELRVEAQRIIGLIARSQHADGALNSWTTVHRRRPLEDAGDGHELYCSGHLIQAAVAWRRAFGEDELLEVARRHVEFIAAAQRDDARLLSQHPGLEMALVEYARETGDTAALELAVENLLRRGHGFVGSWRFSPEHFIDDVPVHELTQMHGHAVMALFLACGAVDAAVETSDSRLLAAVERQWQDMLDHKTSLTGGVGSRQFDEGFGSAYELASDTAYNETCAAVASIMLSWRLLLATGRARYAELIERTLINAALSGVATDGLGFLYSNPLQVHRAGGILSPDGYTHRQDWFECACCPPNLIRTISALGELAVTRDRDGLQLHQYVPGDYGTDPAIRVETDLPHGDGHVGIEVIAAAGEWTLTIRRAEWMEHLELEASWGAADAHEADGWISIRRRWRIGDRIELRTALPLRRVRAHARVSALTGQIAFLRGPVVLALEDPGMPDGADLELAVVPPTTPANPPTAVSSDLAGLPVRSVPLELCEEDPRLYRPDGARSPRRTVTAGLVPYAAWGNRGACRMRVWLPTASAAGH